METLEKFKYYKSLFLRYRKLRFGLLRFGGLSVLIVMLGVSKQADWITLSINFIIVFTSLFVFRWIDDAWSFYNDRVEHPERFYIFPEYLRNFAILGILIYVFYLIAIFLYSFLLAQTMLFLFIMSTVLYAVFYKNKFVRLIIPILKYPVLIWCISGFSISNEVLNLALGSFFMMIAVDFLQENESGIKGIPVKLALLMATGILVMQPLAEKTYLFLDVAMITIPLIFLFLKPVKALVVLPAIYYPVMHIIDILL